MTKTAVLFLGAGFVALVIVIAILVRTGCPPPPPPPPKSRVEITAPKDTQVFKSLPGESEQQLGVLDEVPLVLKVEVGASVILRYKNKEKIFPSETWEDGKIIWHPVPDPIRPRLVSVSINAVPWAKVFIKLPKEQSFIKPQREHFTIPPDPTAKTPNVTPIRGRLKVPVGTAIKLVYSDKEKTFGYEAWKTSKTISHDFMEP